MTSPMLQTYLIWCLGAFLAGSVPFGLILMRLAGKGDVRAQGSGNIAATVSKPNGGNEARLWMNFSACLKLQNVSGNFGSSFSAVAKACKASAHRDCWAYTMPIWV